MGLRWRLRGIFMKHPHCKAVLGRKFSKSRQERPKNSEKAHTCAEPRRLTYFAWKSVQGLQVCGQELKNQKKSRGNIFVEQFRTYGEKKPLEVSWLNFVFLVDIRDIITYITFGDDRLWGLGMATWQGVEFPISPLTSVVALTTLSLPCECVITMYAVCQSWFMNNNNNNNNTRETSHLYQRVSVLVQRFNAVLLHDSLPVPDCTDWASYPFSLFSSIFKPPSGIDTEG